MSSRGRQVKTRMWNDQDAEDDFEERISSSPAPRPKSVKQNHPRVNPDSTLNLKLKLSFIKETLGEEGFAKGTFNLISFYSNSLTVAQQRHLKLVLDDHQNQQLLLKRKSNKRILCPRARKKSSRMTMRKKNTRTRRTRTLMLAVRSDERAADLLAKIHAEGHQPTTRLSRLSCHKLLTTRTALTRRSTVNAWA